MKKLFVFLFSFLFLFGVSLNEDLLYIEAKLYPKIMMLTSNLSQKKIIKVAIVADSKTFSTAKKYKSFFPKNKKFYIKIIKKINLSYDVYIFTYVPNQKILKKLLKNKKILFTLLPDNVKNVMFGIYIGVRVYPYINPKVLREADVRINPIIFKVGKIYEK